MPVGHSQPNQSCSLVVSNDETTCAGTVGHLRLARSPPSGFSLSIRHPDRTQTTTTVRLPCRGYSLFPLSHPSYFPSCRVQEHAYARLRTRPGECTTAGTVQEYSRFIGKAFVLRRVEVTRTMNLPRTILYQRSGTDTTPWRVCPKLRSMEWSQPRHFRPSRVYCENVAGPVPRTDAWNVPPPPWQWPRSSPAGRRGQSRRW